MAHIVIRGLDKYFGSLRVLHGVDLEIAEKEFVTLLGPSGCGKTTTLRLLAGFLEPDGGEIRVGGEVLSAPGATVPPERRRMGMVFQSYAVWPHMTVAENVAFGLRLAKLQRREIDTRVARVLAAVGLDGMEGRHPGQLSGGQQQRVALARSLVVEPSILLLDEPLSNLDAKLRERMRVELKALQRRTGITFVYVTHDQAEAMALSDRIAVFHAGRVQQYGPPREIYERPANLFVADFMGLVNKLPAKRVGPGRYRLAGGEELTTVVNDGDAGVAEAVIAIRPEAIRLAPLDDGEACNRLPGRIAEATFLGNLIDCQVEAAGSLLRVQAERRMLLEPGQLVELEIPVRECVAMRQEDDSEAGPARNAD